MDKISLTWKICSIEHQNKDNVFRNTVLHKCNEFYYSQLRWVYTITLDSSQEKGQVSQYFFAFFSKVFFGPLWLKFFLKLVTNEPFLLFSLCDRRSS